MKRIYKYTLTPSNKVLAIPGCLKIISVESQRQEIVVYALIETSSDTTKGFEFLVIGTGHDINVDIDVYEFLGTVSMVDGTFMFHVFYREIF